MGLFRLIFRIAFWLFALWVALLLLYWPPLLRPPSTLMLASWLSGEGAAREWTPLSDISPQLIRAVIAAEDARYCEHSGVDWEALHKVAQKAIDGEETRGASTIAMQTAKNLFLWPSRHYVRKALEVPMALTINALWGKKRVLEIYLNIAELGSGIFGAQAAAQHYYGKPAKSLNASEAAQLAAILPNPTQRNPKRLSPSAAEHAQRIRQRAVNASLAGCIFAQDN